MSEPCWKPERQPARPRAANSTLPVPARPLPRETPLERTAQLPRVNRDRQARREAAGEVYGPHYLWVRAGAGGHAPGCLLAAHPNHVCMDPIDCHHVDTVGSGGVDAGNCARLCRNAHRLSPLSAHGLGSPERFLEVWGVDLRAEARRLWALSPYNAENGRSDATSR